jgi:hypothetical protein
LPVTHLIGIAHIVGTYIGMSAPKISCRRGAPSKTLPTFIPLATHNLNGWGLSGDWTIGDERAVLNKKDGSITFKFHARDLHLAAGPAAGGAPVRLRVTIDGAPPRASHGIDVDANGWGAVTQQRLYQLVRQTGLIIDRPFEIRLLDPGVEAYAFTFG